MFEKYGVDLVSVSEAFDSSVAVGKLMLHLLGSFAEWERALISERTSEAITFSRSLGKAYGPTPFGYIRKDDRLVPHNRQQETLRLMRVMKTSGLSLQKIADTLNERNMKPKHGKKWYASSIKSVLESRMQSEVIA